MNEVERLLDDSLLCGSVRELLVKVMYYVYRHHAWWMKDALATMPLFTGGGLVRGPLLGLICKVQVDNFHLCPFSRCTA